MKQNTMAFTPQNISAAMIELTLSKKNQLNEYYLVGVGKLIFAKNNRQYKKELTLQIASKIYNADYGWQAEAACEEEQPTAGEAASVSDPLDAECCAGGSSDSSF